MKNALEAITGRRSIRRFTDHPVAEVTMRQILAAGCAAPSAKNAQPVRFIVLDKDDMARIAEAVDQKAPFQEGQWAIAVCADLRNYSLGLGWIEDCAAAMENMQIAATGLELGALWYGVYRREPKESQVREVLQIPQGVEVLGITVIGYKGEEKEGHSGVDEARVRRSVWSD